MHSPPQRRNSSLSAVQKQMIVDERERRRFRNMPFDQAALAKWACQSFRFLRPPRQATMSRILRMALRASLFPLAVHKRLRFGAYPELEEALRS